MLRKQWPKSGCASLIFSLRATLPEKLASKKRRSTRKKFRAPIHRECVLRQSKHCDLSREDAEKHTENTQTEKTETESLLGGFSSVEGELCHFATTSNQCTETHQCRRHCSRPALLVLRCFPVQRVFNHQAPLICQEWNFSRSREFLGYITPVTKTTTTPSLPPISG